jgi:hypothetical protein
LAGVGPVALFAAAWLAEGDIADFSYVTYRRRTPR